MDVREPDEVSLGSIPSSVNLPLSELKDALSPNFGEGDFKKVSLFSFHPLYPSTHSSSVTEKLRLVACRLLAYSPLLRRDSADNPEIRIQQTSTLPKHHIFL